MDISNLTDEQIMNMVEPPADATSSMTPVDESGADDQNSNTDPAANNEPENKDPEAESQQAEGDADDEGEGNPESEQEPEKDPTDPESDKEKDTNVSEAQATLDKIFQPFIANGKEIKIDNADDAIRLMQMGAGFNKKMAALKPHLKIVKMLENNGLLDESKLHHLIDISKKDPNAISKLLADSGIDPLNLNSGKDYKPTTYTVDDTELELDDVLGDLKDSPHYKQTLEIIVDKWDKPSSKLLLDNPNVIRTLHDHMSSGIFDKVVAVVERERALGKLTGLSDLHAYKAVGDAMEEQGLFGTVQPKQTKSNPVATVAAAKVDESLKSRKLAASPTKSSPGKKDHGSFDPLKATDEEIMAMSLDKFL